jgi:hypothetical protein
VETPEEKSELKRLKERVRELEKALCDSHIDCRLADAYTLIACRKAGLGDVADFKKKNVGMLSTFPPSPRKG